MIKMIHAFKSCGIAVAIDSRDGSVRALDPLMYDMIQSLPPSAEMTKELPTSIRYAYAKYDSQDLSRAYKELYDLYTSEKTEYISDNDSKVYIADSAKDTEVFRKVPYGSIVKVHADSAEEAVRLKDNFPNIYFEFAIDESAKKVIDDAVVVFRFAGTDELIDKVNSLFDSGIKKIAGYPAYEISDSVAAEAYDKLCRELVRMRKKGLNGVFVPFCFEKTSGHPTLLPGNRTSGLSKGTFASVYIERGQMPFNTLFLNSDVLIDKCVECAVVLTLK